MCAMSVPPINGYSKVSMASTCWHVAQRLSHAGTKIWDDQGNFRYSLCAGVLVSIPQASKLHDYLIQIGFNYTVVILAAGSFHYAVWLPCFQTSELKGQWLIFLGKLVENRCTNRPERKLALWVAAQINRRGTGPWCCHSTIILQGTRDV